MEDLEERHVQVSVRLFGRNDNPVNYNPDGHNYKIKVRSERRQVSKRSDWSPALAL